MVASGMDGADVEHAGIVNALGSGDAELARAAATVHIAGVEQWLVSMLAASRPADHARTGLDEMADPTKPETPAGQPGPRQPDRRTA